MNNPKTMRDAVIEGVYRQMEQRDDIFFLSADMGAPKLDALKVDFKDRFINVGIAEQNLTNVATGLALEGYTVYIYLIASFVMRAFEVIRNNLAISSTIRPMNVNIIGQGSGFSYQMSGPTHHCLEDMAAMYSLPNMTVFSPSDPLLVEHFVLYSVENVSPKYIRCDGAALVHLDERAPENFETGYRTLRQGNGICFVATGVMTHVALEAANLLEKQGVSATVVDLYMLRPLDKDGLRELLSGYARVLTVQEAFVFRGGIDAVVNELFNNMERTPRLTHIGMRDEYCFTYGKRSDLHKKYCMDAESIARAAL